MEAKGPLVDDVRSYRGVLLSSLRLTNYDGCDVMISKEKESPEEVECPNSIKKLWLNKMYSTSTVVNLSDPLYYDKYIDDYSVWSFPLHLKQMKQVLLEIPKDYIIIAPGDGLGLVRSLWKGIVISGDMSTSKLTYEGVERESMVETVHRGLSLKGKKIVVLSYCQQFFTEAQLSWLVGLGLPMVILEASRSITTRVPGLVAHNMGIYSLGTKISFFHVDTLDFRSDPQVILSSEICCEMVIGLHLIM